MPNLNPRPTDAMQLEEWKIMLSKIVDDAVKSLRSFVLQHPSLKK